MVRSHEWQLSHTIYYILLQNNKTERERERDRERERERDRERERERERGERERERETTLGESETFRILIYS